MTDTISATTDAPASAEPKKPARRNRGVLAEAVRVVCSEYARGTWAPESGGPLTPVRIVERLMENGLEGRAPSTGAVASVLRRWQAYGYAVTSEAPFAFEAYSEQAYHLGLAAMREKYHARVNGNALDEGADLPAPTDEVEYVGAEEEE